MRSYKHTPDFSFKDLVKGYVAAALWSSNDESTPSGGEPLDKNYDRSDIATDSLKKMKRDCAKFMKANKSDIAEFIATSPRGSHEDGGWALVGHCFWLNRNGHGTGFWDRDAGDVGERLSEASRKFGESDLYVGDDGKIYVS